MKAPTLRYLEGMERLIGVIQELSLARDIGQIIEVVRHAARELTGADGATLFSEKESKFIMQTRTPSVRFGAVGDSLSACISGWAILHAEHVVIEDIYADERIPYDAYRPTFVKSLAMMPVRRQKPIAAIGNYWAERHLATAEEIRLLQSLADSTSIAIENVQHYADLRKQLELRDEFIAVAAHELQTPLTPLHIQAQFLQRLVKAGALDGHPRAQELTQFAELTKRRLSELADRVESLLDVSRIRLGQLALNPKDNVNLAEIVRRAIDACPKSDSPIELSVESEPQGRWDSARIEQALKNILGNAIRFGEKKPIKLTVSEGRQTARIAIRDHGVGIAKENHVRIFERAIPFKNYGGMGLGLFIADQIIRAHGGTIQVESEIGDGATFTIELPKGPGTTPAR